MDRTPELELELEVAVGSIGLTTSDAAGTIGSRSIMDARSIVAPLIEAAEGREGFGSEGVTSESGIALRPLLEFLGLSDTGPASVSLR